MMPLTQFAGVLQSFTAIALLYAASLFLGMVACLELGRRLGIRRLAMDPARAMSGVGVVEAAVFALYGLMLAFTFSGAPARLDLRKQLIADEANAIGTAYLRLDLLAAQSQPAMRELFRKYLNSRLEVYSSPENIELVTEKMARCSTLQKHIWAQAIAGTKLPGSHDDAARLLLPALNQMFDITTTRINAAMTHPPLIIYALIFVLALVCSVLAGYSMARERHRSWLHITVFAMVTAISVYAFLEIEYPRVGMVRLLGATDQLLVGLRESM
jgi:hypothetical protein